MHVCTILLSTLFLITRIIYYKLFILYISIVIPIIRCIIGLLFIYNGQKTYLFIIPRPKVRQDMHVLRPGSCILQSRILIYYLRHLYRVRLA